MYNKLLANSREFHHLCFFADTNFPQSLIFPKQQQQTIWQHRTRFRNKTLAKNEILRCNLKSLNMFLYDFCFVLFVYIQVFTKDALKLWCFYFIFQFSILFLPLDFSSNLGQCCGHKIYILFLCHYSAMFFFVHFVLVRCICQ